MYPDGWIKFLVDGSRILGTDELVQAGRASWRNSSQNIERAVISHQGYWGEIKGSGLYWQADDYEVRVAYPSKPTLLRRRISRQIRPGDNFFVTRQGVSSLVVAVYQTVENTIKGGKVVPLSPQDIGQWLSVVVPVDGMPHWYISEDKA
jgi:hypothetical protein